MGHFSFHLAILTFRGMGRVAVVFSAFLWECWHFHFSGNQMERKGNRTAEEKVYSALKCTRSQVKSATGCRVGEAHHGRWEEALPKSVHTGAEYKLSQASLVKALQNRLNFLFKSRICFLIIWGRGGEAGLVDPRTRKTEACRSLWVPDQSGLQSETLFQTNKQTNKHVSSK